MLMKKKYTIFHNPSCSKSRQALEILHNKNISPNIVLYLEKKLSKKDLKELLQKLGLSIRDILRKGENDYKNNNLNNEKLSDDQLINYVIKFPKLLERPIFLTEKKGLIARPPERILELL
jgi:arsenate reductase